MRSIRILTKGVASVIAVVLASCATVSEPEQTPVTGSRFPNYNSSPLPPDPEGMNRTAAELAPHLQAGFNIGNTLEAIGGETAWGNPKISPEFVNLVQQKGFTAIRLPVSWDQYANQETAEISASWLNRVKQVVQYGVDAGLYVLVNIHWDGGWLENNVTPEKQAAVSARQKAYWEQIATALRDFDDRVLFASANEPNVKTAEQMAVLLTHHQTFVDAVRSTGGRNAYRVLVVQGPNTDIELTNKLMTALPHDTAAHRLMVEIHDYTPWNFTGMTKDESWGNQFYYWGKGNHSATDTAHNPTWGEEDFIDSTFVMMKQQFVDRGIPVIIGEFGTQYRSNLSGAALKLHQASRVSYFGYLARQARERGLLPFVWDTGSLLDRRTLEVREPDVLAALVP